MVGFRISSWSCKGWEYKHISPLGVSTQPLGWNTTLRGGNTTLRGGNTVLMGGNTVLTGGHTTPMGRTQPSQLGVEFLSNRGRDTPSFGEILSLPFVLAVSSLMPSFQMSGGSKRSFVEERQKACYANMLLQILYHRVPLYTAKTCHSSNTGPATMHSCSFVSGWRYAFPA